MNVKITRVLSKQDNLLIENLSVIPRVIHLNNDHKSVYSFIKILYGLLSVADNYKLINSEDFDYSRTNTFIFDDKIKQPELYKEFNFTYIPNLGKKKCKDCIHSRIYKNKYYCVHRGIELKGNDPYWDKCMHYIERSKITI